MSSPIASRFGLKSCLLLGAAIVPSIALAQQLCDTAETPPESYCAPVTRCSGGICVIEQPLCIAQLEVWPDGTADGSTCTGSQRFRDIASAARCAGPGSFIFVHGVDAAGTPRPYTAPQEHLRHRRRTRSLDQHLGGRRGDPRWEPGEPHAGQRLRHDP